MNEGDLLINRYPMAIISAWGMTLNGKRYQPCCKKCRSLKLKRLKGPLKVNGEVLGFRCVECKKPVRLGMEELKGD